MISETEKHQQASRLLEEEDIPDDSRYNGERGHGTSNPCWIISVLFSLLIGSILLNVLLVSVVWASHNDDPNTHSSETGIDPSYHDRVMGYSHSVYTSHNETEADEAWNKVNIGHGLVAVDKDWARAKNLPPSREWKPDRSKLVYSLAVYHPLHCMPYLRRLLKKLFDGGEATEHEKHHSLHCIDTARAELMCTADDSLLTAPIDIERHTHLPIGLDQNRRCRNFEAIRNWASAHDACYLTVEDHPDQYHWANCHDTDGWTL